MNIVVTRCKESRKDRKDIFSRKICRAFFVRNIDFCARCCVVTFSILVESLVSLAGKPILRVFWSNFISMFT